MIPKSKEMVRDAAALLGAAVPGKSTAGVDAVDLLSTVAALIAEVTIGAGSVAGVFTGLLAELSTTGSVLPVSLLVSTVLLSLELSVLLSSTGSAGSGIIPP